MSQGPAFLDVHADGFHECISLAVSVTRSSFAGEDEVRIVTVKTRDSFSLFCVHSAPELHIIYSTNNVYLNL